MNENIMGVLPGTLCADGTKCKCIGADGKACKGDIKVLPGVNYAGEVIPPGTWTHHETWQQTSEEMQGREVHFPDGTTLVCDGEIGLAESLSKLANDEQCSQWHINRDLYHAMHHDGGRMPDVKPMQKRLRGIMAIELPEDSFEKVSDGHKAEIRQKMEDAEKDLDKLIIDIGSRGYSSAANYLERSKHAMFGYVRRWLASGLVCPRASSFIERTMRAIGRRIKKLGYNWKEEGVGKMARVVLKMFASDEEWETYWRRRMDLNQTVMLSFKVLNVA